MDDRVSLRRITGQAVGDLDPHAIVQVMQELGPEGGDFVVLRATPDRAAAIERGLVAQLFTYGAHVTGEPVTKWCTRCGTHADHTALDHHPDES